MDFIVTLTPALFAEEFLFQFYPESRKENGYNQHRYTDAEQSTVNATHLNHYPLLIPIPNQMSNIKKSGVYKIVNMVNKKYYVGSSNDILGTGGRWNEHTNDLTANRHANIHLQRAWNKYGKDNFSFLILEEMNREQLLEREQVYLDVADKERAQCYNMKFRAGPGGGFSEETREKLSISKRGSRNPNYGKSPSEKTKLKMSAAHAGSRNVKYDKTIYTFENLSSGEVFSGTRFDFVQKYAISRECVRDLVFGRQKQTHGWTLNNTRPFVPV